MAVQHGRARHASQLKHISLLQDEVDGGISDRPEDECDVFHTFFGIAGLSLLGYQGLGAVDPVYAMPVSVVDQCIGSSRRR